MKGRKVKSGKRWEKKEERMEREEERVKRGRGEGEEWTRVEEAH